MILVVEDEEKLRVLLSHIIRLKGFEVTEVNSLKAGCKAIKQTQPDVVLCDAKLQDGNPWQPVLHPV